VSYDNQEGGGGALDKRTLLRRGLGLIATAGAATLGVPALSSNEVAMRAVAKGPKPRFFPGFDSFRIETEGATIHGVMGGRGPPLLLLHGYPQTHAEWHRVAPALAQRFTVVATDLRGYGDSSKPSDGDNHEGYSKRSTAQDQVFVMKKLGFTRFSVVGHDRGGRVAHRMALDHPEAIIRLAVLDIVPTYKLYSSVTKEFASVYYHWFFLIQPAPLPETLIGSNADFYLRNGVFRGLVPTVISDELYADYLRCYQDPATLHAMCEDYRAAATIDLEHDKADLGTQVRCPLLAIWGSKGAMDPLYDVLGTWRERASDVRGTSLPGGHWLPEQLPNELTTELLAFLS
jgi:haloacetate dehalogenase